MAGVAKKSSPIWSFYSVGEDSRYAICKTCAQSVSRGGRNTKTFNTSNLVQHLKKHQDDYKEYEKQKASKTEQADKAKEACKATKRQLSLEESGELVRLWDINDPRAQRVHRRIGEMIAIDCQPFSIVADVDFTRLLKQLEPRYSLPSRRYITEVILPRIHAGVTAAVKKELAGIPWFSFTTDIWSTEVSNDSLLSLTAHWLTDSFEHKSAVLHAQPMYHAHTGEYICEQYKQMLARWEIKNEQVHLIVRDNAANMVKAMKDASLPDLGCFAHTLQLIVNDGVLSQRAVIDTLAVCRQIVGHFRRSSLAYCRLREIQQNLGLAQHRPKQDEPTRWNSTLYMLQTIKEQKMALAAYATEYAIPQLTPNQLDLASKVIAALNPIEEITKSVSTDAASASLIIPFIRILRRTLENHEDDRGIRTMKGEMLSSLNRHYAAVEGNAPLVLASLLDPRFKDKFFSSATERANARALLEARVTAITATHVQPSQAQESPPKRARTDTLNCLSEIIEEAGATVSIASSSEAERYLAEPLIPFHQANSYSWWAENRVRFPFLAKLAQRYLSAPPTLYICPI